MGRVARRYFRQDPPTRKKGPIDLVTPADLEAEQVFRDLVGRRFPEHAVLGEEQGLGGAGGSGERYRWIVDPLDGTTNFAHGLALFAVSIALECDGALEVAVIYDPIAGELFTAERGQGARLNGRRLHVSSRTTLLDSVLCTGFPYSVREPHTRRPQVDVFEAFLARARAVRRLGSAALDLAYVAAGRFDGFWEETLNVWDVAAGTLIVCEAGGRVTRYDDRPLAIEPGQIVASNGVIHRAMLDVIAGVPGA